MENHPIPQDVTGFQFRLIGDMTVKQFAYVAIAGVIVVILWYLPVFILIKAILIPIFGLIGLALAFLPIEGRPLDLMASNFLKALVTPNQYIFQKVGGTLSFLSLPQDSFLKPSAQNTIHPHPEEEEKKRALMASFLDQASFSAKNPLDSKENQFVASLFSPSQAPISPPQPQLPAAQAPILEILQQPIAQVSTPTSPIILAAQPQVPAIQQTPEPLTFPQDTDLADVSKQVSAQETESALEKQAVEIEHELEVAKIKESTQKSVEESKEAHGRVVELDKKLQDILSEKQRLEDELVALKIEIGKDTTRGKTPSQAVDDHISQKVRKIPQSMSQKVGMPTPPDVPNLLMGIIKDPRGNILPNILIEVKDQEDNPVRAFKTNPLGQFASATALQKGVYTLSLEDPQKQHKFELIELTVNDQIIQPLEIISLDAREELRQQLFN